MLQEDPRPKKPGAQRKTMKLKDDKGEYFIAESWSITAVSLKERRDFPFTRRNKKRRNSWSLEIMMTRDSELFLHFKSKKQARAAYDKVVKRIKEFRDEG